MKFKRPEVFTAAPLRILDFDVEARPLGWLGGDYVHQEITAIASAWIVNGDYSDLEVWHITKDPRSHKSMLRNFRQRYAEADMVVGHYIRGYDLPQVNAAMIEFELQPLTEILSHDTKNDLVKYSGTSKSQENLSAELGIEAPKIQMNAHKWREANRLTPEGLRGVRERASGDVIQNIHMREEMMRRGMLGAPKMWYPGSAVDGSYTP